MNVSGRTADVARARPSINATAQPLVEALVRDAHELRIGVTTHAAGCRIVDAGIGHPGGLEAGRRIAGICLGGLGDVRLSSTAERWPLRVSVTASDPVLACLGSQYAGWSLSAGEGKGAFHALGSGPGRSLSVKEALFEELAYRDAADATCLVLEVDKTPPDAIVEKVTRDCGIAPERLTFILTPTHSLAGVVQIVARVLEVALHKVHTLGFPLEQLLDGSGSAPVPPPAPDFLNAMGRTNDAIIFGGVVELFVDGEDDAAKDLAERLPSSACSDYGRPFAQVFKEVKYDFYKIDANLFAPAAAVVCNVRTGKVFRAGTVNDALLAASFGE
ncbi:MAG TPA: methenyltetrahydromethanopterin cyclohydrolase [Burkholderiales bacterium]|nr:methenyltetrahydromethanopterin cyclohydrolase [Betaproteobacteria bacterium]HQR51987.1 methenyltetrahydromethanopterin cyclohydrolase [Burkholderiales bacterium]